MHTTLFYLLGVEAGEDVTEVARGDDEVDFERCVAALLLLDGEVGGEVVPIVGGKGRGGWEKERGERWREGGEMERGETYESRVKSRVK